MTSSQLLLSDYLQSELYHVVGAYSVSVEKLSELEEAMSKRRDPESGEAAQRDAREQDKLRRVTRLARQYNEKLLNERNLAQRCRKADPTRVLGHPIPDEFPLTLHRRFCFGSGEDQQAVEDARRNPWAGPIGWGWVLNFYDAALAAFDYEKEGKGEPGSATSVLAKTLVGSLAYPRDRPTKERKVPSHHHEKRLLLRRRRFEHRLEQALKMLPGVPRENPHRSADATEFFHRLAHDNLSSGDGSVPLFVINALAEAHLTHHAVEAWQSMSLGAHATYAAEHLLPERLDDEPDAGWDDRSWLLKELDRSIVLSTFAYCASRSAPWMFAADDAECQDVFRNFGGSWEKAVPARCMWISAQMSLLALHRRAYAYGLKGKRDEAYNDYYKLLRQIRNARRRVELAPIHMNGALGFLGCLESRANQNIGELYRAEHAQRPALKYFQTALEGLKAVERRGELGDVLTHSRWRVELQISQGKASYEMGKHKDALRWHLEAWQAFLKLLAAETHTEASTELVAKAIEWLDEFKLEPELRKGEVEEHLGPIVSQLNRIQIHERLGGLASEILLRLGHVLLVLRLSPHGKAPLARGDRRPIIEASLALCCLQKAAECNPHSTLAAADLLKARLRMAGWIREGTQDGQPGELLAVPEYNSELELPEATSIVGQWPRGGDDYERIARVTEYLTLLALNPDTACSRLKESLDSELRCNAQEGDDEKLIARGLLLDFFTHTDSIGVRKAQAHRYLLKGSRPIEPPGDLPPSTPIPGPAPVSGCVPSASLGISDTPKDCNAPADSTGRDGARQNGARTEQKITGPAIEFVCMRRYSSAFPLLPRPSAFKAQGGGYLVRLHPRTKWIKGKPQKDLQPAPSELPMLVRRPTAVPRPVGIVVDPGPDFVENLFRTGFSFDDIDMIIVTHDHVDHLNSLEMLLSLLNYRDDLLLKEAAHSQPSGETGPEGCDSVVAVAPPPVIYGNDSVFRRYQSVILLNPDKAGKDKKIKEKFRRFRRLSQIDEYELPYGFSITSMSSADVNKFAKYPGHRDLSGEPSMGVCFRHEDDEDELSLAITSDVPAPPLSDGDERAHWKKTWGRALRADALIGHVSTVPMTELRQTARIDGRKALRAEDMADVQRARELVQRQLEELKQMVAQPAGKPEDRLTPALDRLASVLVELDSAAGKVAAVVGRPVERGEPSPPDSNLKQRVKQLARVGSDLSELCGKVLRSSVDSEQRPVLRDRLNDLTQNSEDLAHMATKPPSDADRLEQIRAKLEVDPRLRGRTEYAMWLRSHGSGQTADLAGRVKGKPGPSEEHWHPPVDHPYLSGIINWARTYRDERDSSLGEPDSGGLFVLGELSEELGTARGKVAARLNQTVFRRHREFPERSGRAERPFSALTSDIGLRFFIVKACEGKSGRAKVSCTTCDLDNDRVPDESHHAPDGIVEVCVKGENEGIFYNCKHHDPANQEDPLFLERLERFDVFGY